MGALPPIAMAMQAAGGLIAADGEARALRAGARVDTENARLSLLSGEQDALDLMREERRMAGAALAELAGSGLLIGGGSAADVIADSAFQRELEIASIRRRARGEQRNYLQAASDKRSAARAAMVNGMFGAVSTVLGGVSDMRRDKRLREQGRRERDADRPKPRGDLGHIIVNRGGPLGMGRP